MAAATDFVQDAARRVWGVQALAAFSIAVMFVAFRGRVLPEESADLWGIGWFVALVSAAPLWAALYRFELGGSALRGLGPAGIQFGKTELRLIVLALAFFCAVLLAWLPVVAVSAVVFVLFRGLGQVQLGPLGGIQISFIIAMAVWLAALGAFFWACARMAFAPAATVGKRRLVLREAWEMSAGRATTILAAWTLAQAPTMLVLALIALVDQVERADPAWAVRRLWPLLDASVAGTVLGLVVAFVQVPLTVGVLGYLYRARRERARMLSAKRVHAFEPELFPG